MDKFLSQICHKISSAILEIGIHQVAFCLDEEQQYIVMNAMKRLNLVSFMALEGRLTRGGQR